LENYNLSIFKSTQELSHFPWNKVSVGAVSVSNLSVQWRHRLFFAPIRKSRSRIQRGRIQKPRPSGSRRKSSIWFRPLPAKQTFTRL